MMMRVMDDETTDDSREGRGEVNEVTACQGEDLLCVEEKGGLSELVLLIEEVSPSVGVDGTSANCSTKPLLARCGLFGLASCCVLLVFSSRF